MKTTQRYSFKKGAASFYIVAFATLILMIIAISFSSIIISEVTRTSNDDLAQSAYDSALAGIEDAKLAFSNYQKCVSQSITTAKEPDADGQLECSEIIWYMENPDCNMVGNILGRRTDAELTEVAIQESNNAGNNMQQFYTCVKLKTKLMDYRTTLSASNQIRVIKAQFAEGTNAKDIKKIRISWFSDTNTKNSNFNYSNFSNGKVTFPRTGFTIESQPPTISLALIQTANTFQMEDFDVTKGSQTNRGMLYFVPTDNAVAAGKGIDNNYSPGYNETKGKNYIDSDEQKGFPKSNNKVTRNLPYAVYCPKDSGNEFACTVDIELPNPVGGDRSNDNFLFVVGLPYGKPATDVALEFLCADNNLCSETIIETADGDGGVSEETSRTNVATLEGVQIEIDSTGRANNLYRRVKSRLQGADAYDLSIMGPLELLGENNGNPLLNKNFATFCEWNFPNRGC